MRNLFSYQILPVFFTCFTLLGCTSGALSGSASMRIEVEVYKGSLSEEPEIQWGTLLGQVDETYRALIEIDNFARAVIAHEDFDNVNSDSDELPLEWPVPRVRKIYEKKVLGQEFEKKKNEFHLKISNFKSEIENLSSKSSDNIEKETFKQDKNFLIEKLNIYLSEHDNQSDGKLYSLCEYLPPTGLLNRLDFADCLALLAVINDSKIIRNEIDAIKNAYPQWFGIANKRESFNKLEEIEVKNFLIDISRLSTIMRDKVFRWVIGAAAGQSLDYIVRITVVNSIVASSELGNQLKNRSDALMKQMGETGLDRRELPPSVSLRDAEPTDFIKLYKWMDATSYSLMTKYLQGIGSVEDRIKIIERLFSNQFWSKINTVYASGRGKVSMAFIKDDVGNWNLKSFDNDPAELLQAYTTVSLEALKKAAELVAAGSSGGASVAADLAITQLIDLANQNSFDSPRQSSEKSEIEGVLKGLNASLITQLTNKEKRLNDSLLEIDPDTTLGEIKEILSLHSNIVDGLAKGAINQP